MTSLLLYLLVTAIGTTASSIPLNSRATTKQLPAGWIYSGCKVDVGLRVLVAANQVSAINTPQNCISFCSSQGYTMAGVEYSQECWCGSSYNPSAGAVQSAADGDCSTACAGDSTQTCGGSSRIQVYQTGTSTSTTRVSSTSTTAAPTSTGAGKRGLAWPQDNPFDPAIFKSKKINWLYNWGHKNTAKNKDFPFYAMQWSTAGISTLAADAASSKASIILAFNEPDNSGQANMTPASAATYYKQYIHPLATSGYKLASPAITNGGSPAGIAWMDAFLSACSGCTIDYIAIHWYGGWIDDFKAFVDSAKKYNKPILLSEFGLAWDGDAQAANYEEFLPLALAYLDSEPAVAKYAFFGAFYSGTGKDMITANGTLTNLGKIYTA